MHDFDREALKARVKTLLRQHQGPNDCITMTEIYHQVTGNPVIPWRRYDQSRIVRSIIAELRREQCPIGDKGGRNGGYFWARNEGELQGTIRKLHGRAMSSLRQEAILKNIPFNELLKQYEIELTNEEQESREQETNTH